VPYRLHRLDTGALVRIYDRESDALAFVRDVVRLGSRHAASGFALAHEDEQGSVRTIAEGEALVRHALQDQAET
jgi:hypothetical protein